jgi:hypothetical protein
MERAGLLGGRRRLLGAAPAPASDGGGHVSGSGSSPDAMRIMVGVLVAVIACTLLYCVYCWRWRKRNGELTMDDLCSSALLAFLLAWLASVLMNLPVHGSFKFSHPEIPAGQPVAAVELGPAAHGPGLHPRRHR